MGGEGRTGLAGRLLLAGLVGVLAAALAGCAGEQAQVQSRDGEELVQTLSRAVPADRFEELRLTQNSGDFELLGTTDSEVTVEMIKKAKGRDPEAVARFLEGVQADVVADNGRVALLTKEGQQEPGVRLTGLRYILRVPRSKRVRLEITGSNTNFLIQDVTASVFAKLTNGGITLRNVEGDVTVRAANTRVRTFETDGDLEITNSNGPVEVNSANLRMRARVSTTNADLSVWISSLGVGQYEFDTINAPARVFIPYGAGVRIQSATTNGRIVDQLPMTWTDRSGTDDQNVLHLDGWLNAGGAQLVVTTTNSDITLAYR